MDSYETIASDGVPIKAWTRGVPVEEQARQQLRNIATLPFIRGHIAVMPDVHFGIGATVGSVIPTRGAVIPAAVGVDIGCGMLAFPLGLRADQLPDSLAAIRRDIEAAIPVGMADHSKPVFGGRDRSLAPARQARNALMRHAGDRFATLDRILEGHFSKDAKALSQRARHQAGSLGGGNHFIELCIDEGERVWAMLHSGSRGIGNRIGTHFIERAREEMRVHQVNLPDRDLAYLTEGTPGFAAYVAAVGWAQDYAAFNRRIMRDALLEVLALHLPVQRDAGTVVSCHHNYISHEHHFGEDIIVTRKGAVSARAGEMGIIPGSMGARSFIVRGKGNADAFCSCSHGAGRIMSRGEARRRFTLADHSEATRGVECRKDKGVLDETPGAYKDIAAVMAAQQDLVEVVHELRQVVCVKG